MDSEAIRLYTGINETKWNRHSVAPGRYACVAPVYGKTIRTKKVNFVVVPDGVWVTSDSGAFSDGLGLRVTFAEAKQRQLEHAERFGYIDRMDGFASYDLLIDEKWSGGVRRKARWGKTEARMAVDETVNAARFLSENRDGIPCPLILSAQGVTPEQYTDCVRRIAPFFDENDILGLGGWCIMGMRTSLIHSFRDVIKLIVPIVARFTKRIHIWGVMYAPALGNLLWLCDRYGIKLSTDSSGPSVRPVRGVWGYMGWTDKNYQRAPVETRGLDRAKHVAAVRKWLANFRESEFYREPDFSHDWKRKGFLQRNNIRQLAFAGFE